MNIRSTESTYGSSYISPMELERRQQPSLAVPSPNRNADTVSISPEAKALSEGVQKSSFAQEEALPLEAYSLPDWFKDPCMVVYNPKLGAGYADRFTKGGEWEGDATAQEYSARYTTLFQETLRDSGIRTTGEYYESVVLDKEKSARIGEQFEQRVFADEELQRLGGVLGVRTG